MTAHPPLTPELARAVHQRRAWPAARALPGAVLRQARCDAAMAVLRAPEATTEALREACRVIARNSVNGAERDAARRVGRELNAKTEGHS